MEFKTATMADFDVAFDYIEKLWDYNTYDKDVIRKVYADVLADELADGLTGVSKEWDINHYQSLKLAKVEKALPDIYRCLETDKQHAKKIKEVVSNGQIQSGYYQLPPLKGNINRFILFRIGKKGDATLIYIEGEIDSDDLVTLMFSKD